MKTAQMTYHPPLEDGWEFTGEFRWPLEGEYYYWDGKATKAYVDRTHREPIVRLKYVPPSWIKPGAWLINASPRSDRAVWYFSSSPDLFGTTQYIDPKFIQFDPPPYSPYQIPLVETK